MTSSKVQRANIYKNHLQTLPLPALHSRAAAGVAAQRGRHPALGGASPARTGVHTAGGVPALARVPDAAARTEGAVAAAEAEDLRRQRPPRPPRALGRGTPLAGGLPRIR